MSTHYFRYISHMDNFKLFLAAKRANDKKICIKFIHHYLKDIDTFCASEGFDLTLKGFKDGTWLLWRWLGGLLTFDRFPSSLFPLLWYHQETHFPSSSKPCSWRYLQHKHYGEDGLEPGIQACGFWLVRENMQGPISNEHLLRSTFLETTWSGGWGSWSRLIIMLKGMY